MVALMTTRVRRRRGTPVEGAYYRLAPDVKAMINEYADQFDVPTWAIIEAAMKAAKPGPDGVPEGWDLPRPASAPTLDLPEEASTKAA
ncbi:MAG: hypothetical protein K0R62_7668 [Nonomuraea muscovyensis]|nr:hypothetical protein [Nonomuraea muscovyensis]